MSENHPYPCSHDIWHFRQADVHQSSRDQGKQNSVKKVKEAIESCAFPAETNSDVMEYFAYGAPVPDDT